MKNKQITCECKSSDLKLHEKFFIRHMLIHVIGDYKFAFAVGKWDKNYVQSKLLKISKLGKELT